MAFALIPRFSLLAVAALPLLAACSSEDKSAGSGGASGAGATGGSVGASGGSAGMTMAGSAGGAGIAALGGSAGAAAGSGGAQGGTAGATSGAGGTAGASGSSSGSSGTGGSNGGAAGSGGSGGSGAFTLTSPAFDNMVGCSEMKASSCDVFPSENTSYMSAMNISPELRWTGAPAGTQSFAVLLQDRTNQNAHWLLWNIPSSVTMLAANIPKNTATPPMPAGSRQCNASFAAGDGYFGPGSACNVYEFVVYALSIPMFSPAPATEAGSVRTQLQALGSQILGTASLIGRANYMMQCN